MSETPRQMKLNLRLRLFRPGLAVALHWKPSLSPTNYYSSRFTLMQITIATINVFHSLKCSVHSIYRNLFWLN